MGFRSHLRHKHGFKTFEAQRPLLVKLFPFEMALTELKITQKDRYTETKAKINRGEPVSKADLGLVIAMDQKYNRIKHHGNLN